MADPRAGDSSCNEDQDERSEPTGVLHSVRTRG
jgi:hypothetical protein